MGRTMMNRIKRLAHIPYVVHIKTIADIHTATIYCPRVKAGTEMTLVFAPVPYRYAKYRWVATRVSKAKRQGGK